MLPCFNHRTWTQVNFPPGRQAGQARQAIRGGWIRKGQKNEHGAFYHRKSGLQQKVIPETEDNDVKSSSVWLLEKCIYGWQIAKRMLLSTLELSFPKTTGIEICPKEPCFLVSITKLGLKSICLLEDKQDKQYAVVGYARVRNPNTELSTTSKVAWRKRTFQKQGIMMLNQDQCDFLKSASMACKSGQNATFNSGTLLPENHWNRNLSERAMLSCFNHQTWTQVDLPPGRQKRQAIRGGWIRKG